MIGTRGSTYRLQLHPGFAFDDAAGIVDYLDCLGITDVYCSPLLQAASGSTHGYDVVDPTRINGELGGPAGLRRLGSALAGRNMRLTVDIVPNHMSIDGRDNRWWWDVLEHGRASRYARHFDIDWPADERVLMPILEDRYGRELEAGALQLRRCGESVVLGYRDREIPIRRSSLDDRLWRLVDVAESDPNAADALDAEVHRLNHDLEWLDRLLCRQHYRLAYWRTANDDLDYRRFFTIASLVGVRVEDPAVFEETHGAITELVRAGAVTGVRVDHVDGLRDPGAYTERLRATTGDVYTVVEKILATDEELPEEWPVQGTTGYDFLATVNGLFVDPAAEAALAECYTRLTGEAASYPEVARAAKQQIMIEELGAEIERLVRILVEVCERHWRHRDRTRRELGEALRRLIASFGVYRTYPRPGRPARPADREHVAAAVRDAVLGWPDADPDLMEFLGHLALLDVTGEAETRFALSLAQVTAPVMAKGAEDTAFYRYHRLISLNEVGGQPDRFGTTVDDFHTACIEVGRRWPATMLALSTHDTKRSADVRARINLLSEIPDDWERAAAAWMDATDAYTDRGAPDRNARYLLFQTLVGIWPVATPRMVQYMGKAAKEARVHTSWSAGDRWYDRALESFVERALSDAGFVASIERFLAEHRIVERGRATSLAQTTLLLTCPGVPDIYQGSEVWDLSLVDPDNRRPVDYARRRRLLDQVDGLTAAETWAFAEDGGPKLWLIARLLRDRRAHPERYRSGRYEPLPAHGPKARHAVAFARDGLSVVVPRLVAGLAGDWGETIVTLPAGWWRDILGEGRYEGGEQPLATLTRTFPVAVLVAERTPSEQRFSLSADSRNAAMGRTPREEPAGTA
jgi:(1->4)-alpha-D-glucan 1-alpha-D-glucosylmutase